MISKKLITMVFPFLLLPFVFVHAGQTRKKRYKSIERTTVKVDDSDISVKIEETAESSKRYKSREFSVATGPSKGLSSKQISEHKQLYAGYVAKRNEVDEQLKKVNLSESNPSYSLFRSLKVAETFARNGSLLHELYFENIAAEKVIGQATYKILVDAFGSLEAFKDDLMATALSARGWAITCYNLDDKRVQNYLLDAHNQMVPVMTIPLLVVDTYEHAYMIDFGINKKEYLAILWDNINWDVVEERVKTWIVAK